MTQRTRTILSGIAVGAACVLADVSLAHAGWCGGWGCGGNSATVGDGIVFDELNVNGKARDPLKNVRIRWAEVSTPLGWKPVRLQVRGHNLSAIDLDIPSITYRGHQLLDMTFGIAHPDGRKYEVKIVKVCEPKEQIPVPKENQTYKEGSLKDSSLAKTEAAREYASKPPGSHRGDHPPLDPAACYKLDFWVKPFDQVPYYELKVKKTATRNASTTAAKQEEAEARVEAEKNHSKLTPVPDRKPDCDFSEQLCKGEALKDDVLWEGITNSAIFYEGDHFDAEHKKVSEEPDPTKGWFNLACAGAVPAKMHLLRHTRAGSDSTHHTKPPQRTAMVKMLTADYCGNGKAWTADGTSLRYKDARDWYTYTPDPFNPMNPATYGKIEAVWGPDGALCLNDPRRTPTTVHPTTCTAPAVTRAEIDKDCTGHSYASAPPWAVGGGGPRVTRIPQCTPDWASGWNKAMPLANKIYVISATPKTPSPGDGNYCDPAGATSPF